MIKVDDEPYTSKSEHRVMYKCPTCDALYYQNKHINGCCTACGELLPLVGIVIRITVNKYKRYSKWLIFWTELSNIIETIYCSTDDVVLAVDRVAEQLTWGPD